MHHINLSEKEIAKPIYRVFSLDRFVETLEQGQLTLVRPSLWEDPWENYLFKFMHKNNIGKNKLLRWYGEDLFAQCWTFHRETDAMWRIYSPNSNGVRVKSYIQPLLEALFKKAGAYALATCYTGKVEYMTKQKIKDLILKDSFIKLVAGDDTAFRRALTLLFKRREFSHEKEVRLIYDCWNKSQIRDSNLLDVEIDPNKHFKSITVDPRMEYSEFRLLKTKFRDLGFKNRIYKSKLYSLEF